GATENFIGAAFRQFRPDFNGFGALVAGEFFSGKGQQLIGIEVILTGDDGDNPIPPMFVGKTDHSGFDNAGKFEENILHFAGINIVATGNQHIVFAVDNVEEAVLIHHANIAGVQPAAAEGFGGFVGFLPVIGHQLR